MSGRDVGVWLVTGASSGFGLALCTEVLARGGRVLACVRDPRDAAELVAGHAECCRAFGMDIADGSRHAAAVAEAVEASGAWTCSRTSRDSRRWGRWRSMTSRS